MPTVTFSSASSHYTLVSNDFLLHHMPQANGAYVKVYLFFLCHSQQPESSLSTAEAAKSLHMIESDVLEALYYWEKEGLLQIREIDGRMELHFLSGSIPPTPDDGIKEPVSSPQNAAAKVIRVEQKPTYSPDELSIYGRDPQIQHLFSSAAASLGQILSQPNLSTLYSFYDYYRLPLDVIEFLIHYCVRNGHRDLRYMERVAQDWADHDIHSAQQAQDYVQRLDVYRPLLKTMGIHRYPTDEDCRTLDRLQQQYQMPTEMMMEACRRTQKRAKTPSFRYLEGILADWHKQGVHTMAALGQADTLYEQKAASAREHPSQRSVNPRSKNKFLNYTQRNDIDYDQLEKELAQFPYSDSL